MPEQGRGGTGRDRRGEHLEGRHVTGARRHPSRRSSTAALLIVGAALVAASAFTPWWHRNFLDPLTGPRTVAVDGTAVAAGLFPLALVALAGLAAALASRGAVRRIVAVAIAAAGAGSVAAALVAAASSPDAALTGALTRPADAVSAARLFLLAPMLAVLGGLLIVAGGVLMIGWRDRPRTVGGAYSPPAAQRDAARRAAARRAHGVGGAQHAGAVPVDRAEWWRSLDAGIDPTDDAASDAGGRLGRRDEVAGPPSGARSEQSDAASGTPTSDGYDGHTRSSGREEADK
jgi:uncharacterized membrane protein (TIGR02234 family)